MRVCVCKGTCLSNGVFQRPCMGKAVRLVQLPAPPSQGAEQNLFCWKGCSTFCFLYLSSRAHWLTRQCGWPGGHLLSRIESQGLQSLLHPSVLSVSASLGTTGVPSERWSVCGCCLFCKMQFIQIWESRDWKWRREGSCLAGTVCNEWQWHQKDTDLTSERAAVFWDEDFNLPSCFGEWLAKACILP